MIGSLGVRVSRKSKLESKVRAIDCQTISRERGWLNSRIYRYYYSDSYKNQS